MILSQEPRRVAVGWGGDYFSSHTLSGHSEGTLLTLEPGDRILGKPAEADRGKSSYRTQLSGSLSVVLGQEEEREVGGQFLCVWAAQPTGLGPQEYGWIEMWIAPHLQWHPTDCCPLSWELSKPLLSFGYPWQWFWILEEVTFQASLRIPLVFIKGLPVLVVSHFMSMPLV